ncbi:hypothetical protein [Collinsella tanakaei]|uniref:hypothetical protein n=1 Tax=Collinsella tanakaei TaxID=626935 RepID=UPI0025A4A322|nr:hypothetical protein [Collinsella tanakaei]MDM8301051.1 hypothetical protein [Collinsella tanakaei]
MEFVILYLLVNIAVGALACFAGKRLFYIMLGALVFLGVLNIGLSSTDGSAASIVIAVVLGIVAALLSKYVYKAGVFLVGAVAGAALGFVVGMLMPAEMNAYLGVIMAVAALLVGLAALRWCDLFVRLGTAYTGSTFMVSNVLAAVLAFSALVELAVPGDALATFNALSSYIGGEFSALYATPILIGTIVLTIVGAIVQKRSE